MATTANPITDITESLKKVIKCISNYIKNGNLL